MEPKDGERDEAYLFPKHDDRTGHWNPEDLGDKEKEKGKGKRKRKKRIYKKLSK